LRRNNENSVIRDISSIIIYNVSPEGKEGLLLIIDERLNLESNSGK